MFKRFSSALVTAALMAVADPAISLVWSKPPDLPVDTKDICKNAAGVSDTPNARVLRAPAPLVARKAELLPMPEEEAGDDDVGKMLIQLGDSVIDLSDALKSWNEEWEPWLNDWIKENLGDPEELLQAASELVEELGSRLGSFLGFGPQAVPAGPAMSPGSCSQILPSPGYLQHAPQCVPETTEIFGADVGFRPLPAQAPPLISFGRPRLNQGGFCYSGSVEAYTPHSCEQRAQSCDEAAEEKVHSEHSAQHLMEIGKKCQSRGDAAMARNCFAEVQELVPGSALAHQAHACLKALARLVDGSEASEMPDLIQESQVDVHRIDESKRMFSLAAKYAKAGDYDNAYLCYAESCAICPACLSGQQAAKELTRLDAARAAERKESGIEEEEPPLDRSRALSDSDWQSREEARHLYELGEHCRVGGDRRMAGDFYREAYEVSPNSYYGQRALQRMEK
jgi:tetratricopeptide (TPR) repeat protein